MANVRLLQCVVLKLAENFQFFLQPIRIQKFSLVIVSCWLTSESSKFNTEVS